MIWARLAAHLHDDTDQELEFWRNVNRTKLRAYWHAGVFFLPFITWVGVGGKRHALLKILILDSMRGRSRLIRQKSHWGPVSTKLVV